MIILSTLLIFLETSEGRFSDSLFCRANILYRDSRFAEALILYDRLLEIYPYSPTLWYNAGNVEFRAGNFGKAIYRYRQAIVFDPQNEDIRKHLALAEQHLQNPPPKNTPLTFPRLFRDILIGIPEDELLNVFLSFWFLFFLCVFVYRFIPRRWKWFKTGLIFTGSVLIVLGGLSFGKFFWLGALKEVVIFTPVVELRSEADDSAKSETSLFEGWTAEWLREERNWIFIRAENGRMGWISRDVAGVIVYE